MENNFILKIVVLVAVTTLLSCSKSEEEKARELIAKEITDEIIDKKIQQKKKEKEQAKRDAIREQRRLHSYRQMVVIHDLNEKKILTGRNWWIAHNDIENWSNGNHDNKPNYGDINEVDLSLYEKDPIVGTTVRILQSKQKEN